MTNSSRRLIAFVAAALLGAPAAAQRLGGGGNGDVSLIRVFLSLLICLVIAALAILMLRQKMAGGGMSLKFASRLRPAAKRLALIESRRIAPQSDLCLVRCDDEDYLLLIAPGSATVLKRSPAPAERGAE